MTRHADHAAKIIAAARIRSRESGRRGGKDDHLADCRGWPSRQRPRHTQPADTDRKPGTTADHSGDSAGPQAQRSPCRIGAHAVSQDREREAIHTALLCTARPQKVRARLQHVLADTGAPMRDGACSITPVAGRHPPVGAPVVMGRRRGGGVTNLVKAAAHNSPARLRSARRRSAGRSSPRCAGFAPARGGPITLSW